VAGEPGVPAGVAEETGDDVPRPPLVGVVPADEALPPQAAIRQRRPGREAIARSSLPERPGPKLITSMASRWRGDQGGVQHLPFAIARATEATFSEPFHVLLSTPRREQAIWLTWLYTIRTFSRQFRVRSSA